MYVEICKEIERKINDAEMVLVGIGSELDTKQKEEQGLSQDSKNYIIRELLKNQKEKDQDFYERCKFVYKKIHKAIQNIALTNLAKLLEGKNYFVISTNADECLYVSGFREGRILTPCGRETLFQCADNCNDMVWKTEAYFQQIFKEGVMIKEEERQIPVCPACGKNAVFNILKAGEEEHYCEQGYLPDWERYKKWLSGTLNRKVLVLDLGTDFYQPQLIRWAFERTVMLNQKAYFIRIHETLANIPRELKERASSFSVNSRELFEQWRL